MNGARAAAHRAPAHRKPQPELAAGDVGVCLVEVIVADGAPCSVQVNLDALVGLAADGHETYVGRRRGCLRAAAT